MKDKKLLTTNMSALKKIGLASIAGMAGTILYATFKDSFNDEMKNVFYELAYTTLIAGACYAAGCVTGYIIGRSLVENQSLENNKYQKNKNIEEIL